MRPWISESRKTPSSCNPRHLDTLTTISITRMWKDITAPRDLLIITTTALQRKSPSRPRPEPALGLKPSSATSSSQRQSPQRRPFLGGPERQRRRAKRVRPVEHRGGRGLLGGEQPRRELQAPAADRRDGVVREERRETTLPPRLAGLFFPAERDGERALVRRSQR